jgi:hypothetical protein
MRHTLHELSMKIVAMSQDISYLLPMTKLEELRRRLRPGQVYRREDLAGWSNAVDRHLKHLLENGTLTKLAGGLYYCPKKTAFGDAPAKDSKLVESFLKDHRFLLASPNAYNALGVGTTQLYNETVVYNRKRHGHFDLGGRTFDFRVKPDFPKTLTKEFLLVDLVNNLERLAESPTQILTRVKELTASYDTLRLQRAVRDFGTVRTRKFFKNVRATELTQNAA